MNMAPLLGALPQVSHVPHPATVPCSGAGEGQCLPVPVPSMGSVGDQQYQTQLNLIKLIVSSGYEMMQFNGQRRTGPPKDWTGPPPGPGCEIFIGKIPRDLYEDELFPLLTQYGRLYEMRLMMDFSGTNRGFGFAQYSTSEEARHAVQALDGYAIRPGKYLGVMKSLDNRRLFVGGLPKDKTKEQIMEELSKMVTGIVDVILYSSVVDKTKNRGFAFVEFESHRVAAIARRKMIPGGVVLWDHELAVDWAEPEPEVPEDIMSKVKVLYMRNLMLSTPEPVIREIVEKVAQIPKAAIEKVKKLKDFAFLHFTDRHFAEQALERLDNLSIDGAIVTVVWAKPPRDRVQHKDPSSNRNSFSASDDEATNLGRSMTSVGLPGLQAPSIIPNRSYSPYGFWDALVALAGQREPLADVTSWPNPIKPNGLMFLARVTVPFIQPPYNIFVGNYSRSPQEAMDSAAENVLAWLQRNGDQSTHCLTPPLSPVGFIFPPRPYSGLH